MVEAIQREMDAADTRAGPHGKISIILTIPLYYYNKGAIYLYSVGTGWQPNNQSDNALQFSASTLQ